MPRTLAAVAVALLVRAFTPNETQCASSAARRVSSRTASQPQSASSSLGSSAFHASCRSATALAEGLSFRSAAWTGKNTWPHRGFQACAGRAVLEGVEAELVQQRRHGDLRVVRHRVPQRQGAVGRQFTHKPLRQRLMASSLVSSSSDSPPPMVDDGTLHIGSGRCRSAGLNGSPFHRHFAAGLHGRLVPAGHSLDRQQAVRRPSMLTNTRARAISSGHNALAVLEGRKRHLDLGEPGIDFVR